MLNLEFVSVEFSTAVGAVRPVDGVSVDRGARRAPRHRRRDRQR